MENTVKKAPSRSLGKGLSALMSEGYGSIANENIPEAKQPLQEQPKQTLSLTKIRSGKYQPREIFNDTALNELADSIRKNGVMQPILVRAISDDNYEIVAGERRWRADKLAGL
ncbi:MAG: ParB/RepB/Spo0J family partition protein, partial [Pseudomonadota bacterium]